MICHWLYWLSSNLHHVTWQVYFTAETVVVCTKAFVGHSLVLALTLLLCRPYGRKARVEGLCCLCLYFLKCFLLSCGNSWWPWFFKCPAVMGKPPHGAVFITRWRAFLFGTEQLPNHTMRALGITLKTSCASVEVVEDFGWRTKWDPRWHRSCGI